jgi:hypothetical protein
MPPDGLGLGDMEWGEGGSSVLHAGRVCASKDRSAPKRYMSLGGIGTFRYGHLTRATLHARKAGR